MRGHLPETDKADRLKPIDLCRVGVAKGKGGSRVKRQSREGRPNALLKGSASGQARKRAERFNAGPRRPPKGARTGWGANRKGGDSGLEPEALIVDDRPDW